MLARVVWRTVAVAAIAWCLAASNLTAQTLEQLRAARNKDVQFVGYDKRGGGQPVGQTIGDRFYVYSGYQGGISVLDVTDPTKPEQVSYIPPPANSVYFKNQIGGNILMAGLHSKAQGVAFAGPDGIAKVKKDPTGTPEGVDFFDISDPKHPKKLSTFQTAPGGVHRNFYAGGRYAYLSAMVPGYSYWILQIVDLADPTHPKEASHWALPGMWLQGGEKPAWKPAAHMTNPWVANHMPFATENRTYVAWLDAGVIILDTTDKTKPKLVSRIPIPSGGAFSHTPVPLPDRGLIVWTDEAVTFNCKDAPKDVWIADIHDEKNPVVLSHFPRPAEEDYCAKGGRFGPHNLHENRPGSFISSELMFVTYNNAGVRVVDIKDPRQPQEVGYYVPPPPDEPETHIDLDHGDWKPVNGKVPQTGDVFVDRRGYIYITESYGVLIVRYTGIDKYLKTPARTQ